MKFKSQVYTQASGSIGGVTYSHNKSGMYTRARTIPVNPNTTRQQAVRAGVNGAVQAFQTLTDAQIAGWKLYGDNVPSINALGDPILLSAQQQFVRTNSLITFFNNTVVSWVEPAPAALPLVLDAPTTFNTGESVAGFNLFTAPGTGGVNLICDLSAPASGPGTALFFFGRPQNTSRRFYKGPFQLGYFLDFAATDTQVAIVVAQGDFADFATNVDNPPAAGLWQPMRVVLLYDDGRVSQDYKDFVLWGVSAP